MIIRFNKANNRLLFRGDQTSEASAVQSQQANAGMGLQPDGRLRISLLELFELAFIEACKSDAQPDKVTHTWCKLIYLALCANLHFQNKVAVPPEFASALANIEFFVIFPHGKLTFGLFFTMYKIFIIIILTLIFRYQVHDCCFELAQGPSSLCEKSCASPGFSRQPNNS